MNTYYNNRDGWYFVLPDGWSGKNLILSRSDLPGGGEQAVTHVENLPQAITIAGGSPENEG